MTENSKTIIAILLFLIVHAVCMAGYFPRELREGANAFYGSVKNKLADEAAELMGDLAGGTVTARILMVARRSPLVAIVAGLGTAIFVESSFNAIFKVIETCNDCRRNGQDRGLDELGVVDAIMHAPVDFYDRIAHPADQFRAEFVAVPATAGSESLTSTRLRDGGWTPVALAESAFCWQQQWAVLQSAQRDRGDSREPIVSERRRMRK